MSSHFGVRKDVECAVGGLARAVKRWRGMRHANLLCCLLLLAGCASDTGSADVTKDEAADLGGGADLGRDFCADYGWYGDAECDTFCPRPDPDCSGVRNVDGAGPTLCVGVRGNGPRMTAHWSSLARIVEHHGLIDATAGGSSGSITSFLLDSIETNPHVVCEGCSPAEQAARAALLLKSLQGYVGQLAVSDEVLAIRALIELQGRVAEGGVGELLEDDPTAGVEALQDILQSEDLRALINPEVLELLSTSPDPAHHARDIVGAVSAAASFSADDPTIFVRPGVLSFDGLSLQIGRIASFYAGYAPVDGAAMEAFLADCGEASRGLPWQETTALPAGDASCGERFDALVADYRVQADGGTFPSRLDDSVGGGIHALISTSVLEGDAIAEFERARAQYLAGEAVTWDTDFDDVTFGYWGATEDLDAVLSNPFEFRDGKTAKATSLGAATWREVLAYSPAEPGLARALELPDGRVSAGGWSDLHPTLVLRNLGCEQVIYVTRRGADSTFATGVANLLGAEADDHEDIFDLGAPGSGFSVSVAEADGVWCTDWDTPPQTDLRAMELVGYDAPFEIRDPRLRDGGYENASTNVGFAGCTVGVTE